MNDDLKKELQRLLAEMPALSARVMLAERSVDLAPSATRHEAERWARREAEQLEGARRRIGEIQAHLGGFGVAVRGETPERGLQVETRSTAQETEIRTATVALRSTPSKEAPKLSGYAAVFGQMSEDLGGFREHIRKGAFSKSLAADQQRLYWGHDSRIVLASTKGGTLRLWEDDHGLAFTAELPTDNQIVRDLVLAPIERGDVDAMSIGFLVTKDDWRSERAGLVRELLEVKLIEISPVPVPAYNGTSVSTRTFQKAQQVRQFHHSAKADWERALRNEELKLRAARCAYRM